MLVQNRIAVAEPRLPEEVRRLGVSVRKASPDLMIVVHMISPDGSRDQQYISNYSTLYVKDVLGRIEGVGDVRIFGARDYAMRIWLDPAKVAARGLTASDVVQALRASNLQVAAGAINQPPAASDAAYTLSVKTLGRLSTPEQFEDIVIRSEPGGQFIRVKDVARVELGAQDYTVNALMDGQPATSIVIFQRPGSNALATAAAIKETMASLSKSFPDGVGYDIIYNPTEFIQFSIEAVLLTLAEAVLLVVIVVILFLQTWRAAIIPILAIPVSLIGTFAIMSVVGVNFNTLSLFGLVLAIGIVVDDAIVVVENVERYLARGFTPVEAAHKTMDEVGGALIAISLVLMGVFMPTAFITGLQGTFYKQFAITIAASTAISAFVSLTLSPAMAAVLLKPHKNGETQHSIGWYLFAPVRWFFSALQLGVRQALLGLRWLDWQADQGRPDSARRLCRAALPDQAAARQHADRSHPAARPRLSHHRLPAAAGLDAAADRRRGQARLRDAARTSRRRARGRLRRLRRRDLHQLAQRRRHLRRPRQVRRAHQDGADEGRNPGRSAQDHGRDPRCLRVRARTALGTRHRHRRRPQGLRAGPRRTRPAGARGRGLGDCRAAERDAGLCPGLHLLQHRTPKSSPTSTAPRPSSSACRSRASSRRCRSTWARPSSTTSTFWAAPSASRRRPTIPIA